MIGSEIIFFESLPSTNSHSIKLLSSDKPRDGTIIWSDHQSAGRGQPGKKWESDAGKNLLISIILYPESISPEDQFIISMAISLGILDFLSPHLENLSIKWPNDIYVKNDKIAGILIESSIMGNSIEYLVAGIGLNINQENFSCGASNATSMKRITGKEYERKACLNGLSASLDKRYSQLKEKSNTISDEYVSNLYRYMKWASFRDKDGVFTGRITGVTKYGILLIEKKSGTLQNYSFREVEFIL
jgi:BirA family biotin operon repressor/biotin-[acetyl-CoA-carboxylase] ligase